MPPTPNIQVLSINYLAPCSLPPLHTPLHLTHSLPSFPALPPLLPPLLPLIPPSPGVLHQLSKGPQSHFSLGQRTRVLQHLHDGTELVHAVAHVLSSHLGQLPNGSHDVDHHIRVGIGFLQFWNQDLVEWNPHELRITQSNTKLSLCSNQTGVH